MLLLQAWEGLTQTQPVMSQVSLRRTQVGTVSEQILHLE